MLLVFDFPQFHCPRTAEFLHSARTAHSASSITEDAILHDNLVDAQFELSRVSASASATDAPATTKLRLQLTACAHETTKKESVTKHWAVRFMAAKMFQIWLKGGKVATQDVSLKFKGE